MANGHGGARPGAGRKRKETVEMQGNRRDALLDVVTEKLWRETVKEWFEHARTTKNFALLFPMLPYVMGSAKQEISVSFDVPEVAAELGAEYGVPTDRVTSIVERLKAKKVG